MSICLPVCNCTIWVPSAVRSQMRSQFPGNGAIDRWHTMELLRYETGPLQEQQVLNLWAISLAPNLRILTLRLWCQNLKDGFKTLYLCGSLPLCVCVCVYPPICLLVYLSLSIYVYCIHSNAHVHVEIRRQLAGMWSFRPPYEPGKQLSSSGSVAKGFCMLSPLTRTYCLFPYSKLKLYVNGTSWL